MKAPGGRGLRGSFSGSAPGRRRALALGMVLVFAAGSLAPLAPPAFAQAGALAPWFGPHDKSRPTEGFAVRVPVTVENTHDYSVTNRPVHVSLDLSDLLVQAGWTSQTVNAEDRVRGFTLDVASLRVVEYDRGFRAFAKDPPKPTPHLFAPSLYEESSRGRDFDPANNPIGTVSWVVEGELPPRAKRFYMVYFSPLEYGSHEPATFTAAERALAESIGWGGAANVLYGYENGAETGENRIHLIGTQDKTNVQVFVYRYSAFVPHEADDADMLNPMLLNASELKIYSLPANTLYKIVADKPILAAGHGTRVDPPQPSLPPTYGEGGYIPSTDGGWKGRAFSFPHYSQTVWVIATESGSSTVSFSGGAFGTATVSSGNPIANVQLSGFVERPGMHPGLVFATVSGPPVMLMYGGGGGAPGTSLPSRHGGPVGTDFYGRSDADGGVRAFAFAPASVRVLDALDSRVQLHPEGSVADTPPASVGAGVVEAMIAPAHGEYGLNPVRIFSTSESAYVPPTGAGEIAAFAGGPGSVGSYGGRGGMHFQVPGPVNVIAHYPETKVTVREARVTGLRNSSLSLSADQVLALPGAGGEGLGRYEILSNKPVTVLATEPVNVYARFLTGRYDSIPTQIGTPEFRGRLVDIESPERPGRQIFKTTGPEQPVNFTLRVLNLGRWQNAENLPDDVTIRCESDAVEYETSGGCGETFALSSLTAKTFTVTVTPKGVDPRDSQKNSGTVTVTAVSSAGNVQAKIRLVVRVEVTYGVGLWLEREGGPKEIVDPPTFVDPGDSVDPPYAIVLKNLGSVRDAFEVKHQDPTPGWGVKLLRNDEEVRLVTLDPGESATLQFRVNAPDTREAAANFVEITATSQTSKLAADKVTVATRIRPDIKFAMGLDERTKLAKPNESVSFNVSVENRGNDIFRVTLTPENVLPSGWESDIPFTELDLSPGPQGRQNLTLSLTPPANARAGDLATLNLRGESTVGGGATSAPEFVAATVLVAAIHNLTYPAPLPVETGPGTRLEYTLRLTNHGNGNELLEVEGGGAEPRWPVATPSGEILPVAYGDTLDLPLEIEVPPRTPAGEYDLTIPVRVSREARLNLTLPIHVLPVREATFESLAPLRVSPGQAMEFPLRVSSSGNVPATLTFQAELPPGWAGTFTPSNLSLQATDTKDVTLRLNASRDAADGDYPVRFRATPTAGTPSVTPFNVTVARPDLSFGGPVLTGSVRDGELILVSAPVKNDGDIDARNVRVALFVNGEAVDFATLNRVPMGTERLATLKWTVEGHVEEIRLVLNPEGTIVDATPQDDEVSVYSGRGLPAPGALAVLLLVGAASLAIGRSRRRGPW